LPTPAGQYYPGTPAGSQCDWFFYVPDRSHATATIVFGLWDESNVKFYVDLNEDPVASWQPLVQVAHQHVNWIYINFQDNNGQPYLSHELGWSPDSHYGFWAVC